MNILISHYNPAPPGQGGGGAESAVRDETRALELLGHSVVVSHAPPQFEWERSHFDLVHFHTVQIGLGLEETLGWAQKAGILHFLSLHDYWPFCLINRMCLIGSVRCSANDGLCDNACGQAANVLDTVRGTPCITFNPISAAMMERHGLKMAAVIPHGIDTGWFTPGEKVPGSIITVSAWPEFPTKGMHILKAALEFTGYSGKLVAHATREVVRRELQTADIFVMPSLYSETFGLSLTEAMASGCACIVSDVAGLSYQLNRGEGLAFPPGDAQMLAASLQTLVENPKLARELGSMARFRAVGEFSLPAMAARYDDFFARQFGWEKQMVAEVA